MKFLFLSAAAAAIFLTACVQNKQVAPAPVSREEGVKNNLDSLKKNALTGDLVVRLGDDLLSYQIKFMNESDQSYSHAGIIVQQGNEKMIAHITPDERDRDGIQYTPIDSFLNPQKNLACALYRFHLSPAERDSVAAIIQQYKAANIHFDRVYNLRTDTAMYCSEMISKVVHRATGGRIAFRETGIPPKMLPALLRYFKNQAPEKTIAARKIMTIDNLYRIPECELLMRFPLKFLPGQ